MLKDREGYPTRSERERATRVVQECANKRVRQVDQTYIEEADKMKKGKKK